MALSRPKALGIVGLAVLTGAVVGLCAGPVLQEARFQPATEELPLPHHIPKYPGGVSLRFAMVHDALTERFAKHGKAYYTERNRLVQKELQQLKDKAKPEEKPSVKYFDLLNDLGAGYEALRQHDLAVQVMREKLKEQETLGLNGRDLYTTYANLGTFLIHENFVKARTGDTKGKQLLREGLELIRKSIDVNPEAHFGREIWQAVAVEYMLAAIENPQLLLKFDMVGNDLNKVVDPNELRPFDAHQWSIDYMARGSVRYLQNPSEEKRHPAEFRQSIATVGAEGNWNETIKTAHAKPVPFDEPTLGIIGMWRLGGGANPHFALALGEFMLRVGQRYLAWTAYERSAGMADRFWPDTGIQEKFVEHCRNRQKVIEKQLPSENWEERRRQFQDELDFGRRYQAAYQEFEAKRIQDGASIDDPHFYDSFHAEHGAIASPVGPEDKFMVEEPRKPSFTFSLPTMLFFSGLFAIVTACFLRITTRPSRIPSGSQV